MTIYFSQYQVDSLKSVCEKYLTYKVSVDSVTETLLLADLHQANNLKLKCIDFISEKGNEVMATDGWKSLMVSNRMDLLADLFKNLSVKYKA